MLLGRRLLYSNDGYAKDEKEGIWLIQLGAKQGLPDAQDALGNCYEEGNGVAQDTTEAACWYQLAVNQEPLGSTHVLCSLSDLFRGPSSGDKMEAA